MHGLATAFETVILLYILQWLEWLFIMYNILLHFPLFPFKWIQTLIPLPLAKKPDQLFQWYSSRHKNKKLFCIILENWCHSIENHSELYRPEWQREWTHRKVQGTHLEVIKTRFWSLICSCFCILYSECFAHDSAELTHQLTWLYGLSL